jgi:hypothetical protein
MWCTGALECGDAQILDRIHMLVLAASRRFWCVWWLWCSHQRRHSGFSTPLYAVHKCTSRTTNPKDASVRSNVANAASSSRSLPFGDACIKSALARLQRPALIRSISLNLSSSVGPTHPFQLRTERAGAVDPTSHEWGRLDVKMGSTPSLGG